MFAAGLAAYSVNRDLRFVHWDEFLWYPEVLRAAEGTLRAPDPESLLHPTRWQYPPLFFLAAGALVRLLGESFFSFRLLSILSSASLAPFAFLLGRSAAGARTGIVAGLYTLLFPLAHRYGGSLLVDPFQAALIAAALFLFARAEKTGGSLLPAAAAAALAGSAKYTSLLLPASLAVVLIAGRRLRGPGEGRSRREILLFALLSFAPLLFLRRQDFELLREMSAWKSLPLDGGDLLRVLPLPLLLAALLVPALRRGLPRALAGPYTFLVAWLAFFLWRRQQPNWLLPAAVPLAVLAAHATVLLAAGKRRILVGAAAAALLVYGGWRSSAEVGAYREQERIYAEAAAYVDARVPTGGFVAVDALPFAGTIYLRSPTRDVRNVGFRDAARAILLPWVFENYKIRGFSGSAWGEVHETEIRGSWTLEKRYALQGKPILEVWANPRKSRERASAESLSAGRD